MRDPGSDWGPSTVPIDSWSHLASASRQGVVVVVPAPTKLFKAEQEAINQGTVQQRVARSSAVPNSAPRHRELYVGNRSHKLGNTFGQLDNIFGQSHNTSMELWIR